LLGGNLLDLACGDGFNARNFYSLRSSHIIACDFDPTAIETAQKKNSAPNIQFLLKDIRTDMPEGTFSNITIDGAIEHFTPDEIDNIVKQVKRRLIDGGIFSGYTIIQQQTGFKSLSHHEYEFSSKEDLMRFFTPYFKNVTVFETIFPDRHNLYFWASDGTVPFDSNWPRVVRSSTVSGA
jgi:SAM-dependent methyltransferase